LIRKQNRLDKIRSKTTIKSQKTDFLVECFVDFLGKLFVLEVDTRYAFSVSWFLLRFSWPVKRNVLMVGNITRIRLLKEQRMSLFQSIKLLTVC